MVSPPSLISSSTAWCSFNHLSKHFIHFVCLLAPEKTSKAGFLILTMIMTDILITLPSTFLMKFWFFFPPFSFWAECISAIQEIKKWNQTISVVCVKCSSVWVQWMILISKWNFRTYKKGFMDCCRGLEIFVVSRHFDMKPFSECVCECSNQIYSPSLAFPLLPPAFAQQL